MPRESKINAEVILAAASSLIEKGIPVTNKSIQTEIGGGSMTTIVPLVAAWKRAQEERDNLAEVKVPDEIAVASDELAARLWRAAIQMATTGHEALRRELLASRGETEAVRVEMVELIAAVEDQLDDALNTIVAMNAQIENLVAQRDTDRQASHDMQIELARVSERAQGLAVQLATAQEQAQAEAARVMAAEQRAARAEARADRLEAVTNS